MVAAAAIGFASAAIAADRVPPGSSLRQLERPGLGAIGLPVPTGWDTSFPAPKRPGDPIVVKLGLLSEKSPPFLVILMVQKVPAAADLSSLAKVCKGVEKVRDSMADANTLIHEVRGAKLYGCYFSPPARMGKKDPWKYTTHGTTVLQDLLVSFSVYSNRSSEDQLAPAVEMLQGAQREQGGQ